MNSERRLTAWVEELSRHLRAGPRRRRDIILEVQDHLRESVKKQLSSGVSSDVAQDIAIEEFGDPKRTAHRFNPSPASSPFDDYYTNPNLISGKERLTMALKRQSRTIPLIYGGIAAIVLSVVAAMALVLVPPSPPQVAEFAPQAQEQIEDSLDNQSSQFGAGAGACAAGQVCDFTDATGVSDASGR